MKLTDKFTKEEIEWRVQQQGTSPKGNWAMVLPYVTSRAIMDRLDSVYGVDGWAVSHKEMIAGMSCSISIWSEGKGWVCKEDGAPLTKIESFKGAMSDSLKRAAVLLGIGRYLYALKGPFYVKLMDNKDGEYSTKLDGKYYSWNPPEAKGMYSEV